MRFADGAIGSLNLYRQVGTASFTETDELRIRQVASLLPALYETVRDEIAYRSSRAVNDLLQYASRDMATDPQQTALTSVAQAFCSLLKENLNCFDVSVYLESEDNPEVFVLSGSTLPDPSEAAPFYKIGDCGPTGSALTYREPIRILDLRQLTTYPANVAAEPSNPGYIDYVSRETVSYPKSPLSFIATPILAGEHLLGVLRCCVPLAGPTYFASRETNLLTLLAGQIGQFVSDQRRRRDVYRERRGV